MANPTMISDWAILTNEGAIGSTAMLPAIGAGADRMVLLAFLNYNGAGTASVPSAVSANGRSAQLIAGAVNLQDRIALGVYAFFEADIPFISGQVLTSNTGSGGSQKSVLIKVYGNAHQSVTPNAASAYAAVSGNISMLLNRHAESVTEALAASRTIQTSLALSNPPRTADIALTSGRRVSYGVQNDTLGTSNAGVTAVNHTSAIAFNIFAPLSYRIVSADDPRIGGMTAITVEAFSSPIDRGTADGVALAAATNTQITVAGFVDEQPAPRAGANRNLSVGNATESASIDKTINPPIGLVAVEVQPGFKNGELNSIAHLFDPPLVAGDIFYNDPTKGTVYPDAGFETNFVGDQIIWHHEASTKIVRSFVLTTGEGGVVITFQRWFGGRYPAAIFSKAKKLLASHF